MNLPERILSTSFLGITPEAGERSSPASHVSVVVECDCRGNRVVKAVVEELNAAAVLTGWLLENETVATEKRDAGRGGLLPRLKTAVRQEH